MEQKLTQQGFQVVPGSMVTYAGMGSDKVKLDLAGCTSPISFNFEPASRADYFNGNETTLLKLVPADPLNDPAATFTTQPTTAEIQQYDLCSVG